MLSQFSVPSQKKFILSPITKYSLVVIATLGFATTILDITLLRFGHNFASGPEEGYGIFSARQAYTVIAQTLPEDVIIQYNPTESLNRPSGLYGMRQSVISDRTAYGVSMDQYIAKVATVSEIFTQKNNQNWDSLDMLCNEQSIDVIVIIASDPLWKSLTLLEGQRAALYLDDYYAVFTCGNYAASNVP